MRPTKTGSLLSRRSLLLAATILAAKPAVAGWFPLGQAAASQSAAVIAFLGPINLAATTTAQGGTYALIDSIVSAYLDAQHTNFGSVNDVGIAGAVYDRPMANYIQYVRTGDSKYLTRGHSGVVGYRDDYVVANDYRPNEPNKQPVSMALHYLLTGDATSKVVVGNLADFECGLYADGWTGSIADQSPPGSDNSNSARQMASAILTLVSARYIGAPSDGDGSPSGYPGGNNFATVLDSIVDALLSHFSADGALRYFGDTRFAYAYQIAYAFEALIHYHYLYADVTRKASILAAAKLSERFLWNTMLDQYNNATTFIYLEGPNTVGGESTSTYYQPPGSSDLAAWAVGLYGFLYYQTGDVTYRTRGLALLANAYGGDHASTGAYLTTVANTPANSTQGIQHKVLSELTHTTWRALNWFLDTPLATPAVPVNTALPAITGPSANVYSCSTGTWTGSPSSFNYAWCRRPSGGGVNTVLQSSATSTYTKQAGDVGSRLFCLVTATNASGAGIIARAIESVVVV